MLTINGRLIGPGEPPYVIAEMSCNHHGRYDEAEGIVSAAKEAGADAVKLQTYTPDTMTLDAPQPWFRIKGTIWDGRGLYELYREAMTPWEWHAPLKKLADSLGIHLFSSPFDATAVDFLENLGVPAYKIASFENGDLPLIRRVAATGKPIIMSTGTATPAEVDEAVNTLRAANTSFVLLKCVSAYPAPPEEMNLSAIPALAARHRVPVGLSDHTLGSSVAVAGTALGACVIEKHLTLSRAAGGPDAPFSMEPAEFKEMVASIRVAQTAIGDGSLEPAPSEAPSRAYRRSLFVVKDIQAGDALTAENVRAIRPGNGLAPREYDAVLGRKAKAAVKRGTPLSWDLLASEDPKR
ncbi:MAG TPA: pseudaminic acid synthase [Elusimicrobiota bacterium]|nr:pseudaminic acid synthase [Elusimicrobiota bacterium]